MLLLFSRVQHFSRFYTGPYCPILVSFSEGMKKYPLKTVFNFKRFLWRTVTTFDLASSTGWSTGTEKVNEWWGCLTFPWGPALLRLYLLPKLMIVAAEASQFFLLGIILKTSSLQELVADFLPVMSVAKHFFFLNNPLSWKKVVQINFQIQILNSTYQKTASCLFCDSSPATPADLGQAQARPSLTDKHETAEPRSLAPFPLLTHESLSKTLTF